MVGSAEMTRRKKSNEPRTTPKRKATDGGSSSFSTCGDPAFAAFNAPYEAFIRDHHKLIIDRAAFKDIASAPALEIADGGRQAPFKFGDCQECVKNGRT